MRANHYGLMAFTDGTPASAWERAFASGVETAVGYIDAAVFELKIVEEARRRRAEQDARLHGPAPPLPWSRRPSQTNAPSGLYMAAISQRAMRCLSSFARSLCYRLSSAGRSRTGRPSPYVGDVLKAAFDRAQAVLVLMTPDEEARLRQRFQGPGDASHDTDLTPQARPNVLFEAAWQWPGTRTEPSSSSSDVVVRSRIWVDDTCCGSMIRPNAAGTCTEAG